MAVCVQGNADRRVPQPLADDLRVNPLDHHQGGVGVSQVVKPNDGQAGLYENRLEFPRDEVRLDQRTVGPGADQVLVVVNDPQLEFILFLSKLVRPELRGGGRGQGYLPPALPRLRGLELVPALDPLQCPAYGDGLLLQVDVLPLQRHDLAAPHAGGDRQHDRDVHPAGPRLLEQLHGLLGVEGLHLCVYGPGRVDGIGRVAHDKHPLDGLLQRRAEYPVVVEDRAGGETAFAPDLPVLQLLGVVSLNVDGVELLDGDVSQRWYQVALDDLLVAVAGLGGHVHPGVALYPVEQEGTQCDLHRLDVGAVVDVVDDSDHGALGFLLAVEPAVPLLLRSTLLVAPEVDHDAPFFASFSDVSSHAETSFQSVKHLE